MKSVFLGLAAAGFLVFAAPEKANAACYNYVEVAPGEWESVPCNLPSACPSTTDILDTVFRIIITTCRILIPVPPVPAETDHPDGTA